MSKPRKHPDAWYCNAPKKEARGGGRCDLRAGQGTGHVGFGQCKHHGGAFPAAERAGLAAVTERSFAAWLEKNGTPTSGDPVATLTRLLDRTVAWHAYVEHLVGQLNIEDWEKRSRSDEGVVTTQLSVYVGLLERAQDRAHKHLTDIIRLGVEERLARITERQAEAIIAVLTGAVADLALGAEVEERVHAVVADRLEEWRPARPLALAPPA